MAWMLGIAIACLVWLVWRQQRQAKAEKQAALSEPWRKKQFRHDDEPESRPENPRFPTWDAAFNRTVTDELRFLIEYADGNGEVTEREITPISIHLIRGSPDLYIKAFCHRRQEERTFRSDRIVSARNLKTNRRIGDLGQYLRGRY